MPENQATDTTYCVESTPLGTPEGESSLTHPPPSASTHHLPCQSPVNSNETLSASGKRSQFALEFIVFQFIERYGLDQVGFLTLTFADHLLNPREASRRYNSLRTGVLARRYLDVVKVFERQRSGRIHYHLLVACNSNIRRGVDFEALKRRDYRSAGVHLRSEWAFWRHTAKRYRFGRCELLPIRKSAEAAARYLGKYVGKHVAHRKECDRGVRLVACSHRARAATTRFSWAGGRSSAWRAGVPRLLALLEEVGQLPQGREVEAVKYFGKHWRYRFRETIAGLGADLAHQVGHEFWWEINREWERCAQA